MSYSFYSISTCRTDHSSPSWHIFHIDVKFEMIIRVFRKPTFLSYVPVSGYMVRLGEWSPQIFFSVIDPQTILPWPFEVLIWMTKMTPFWSFWGYQKWHFECLNQNSETTFTGWPVGFYRISTTKKKLRISTKYRPHNTLSTKYRPQKFLKKRAFTRFARYYTIFSYFFI